MLTDNPPKSWLTDAEPVGGNGDHGWIAAGDVASGMVDSRDDSDGVVVPHTDNSRRSEGVIEIDAPVTVDVGVNTEFGEATRVMSVTGVRDIMTVGCKIAEGRGWTFTSDTSGAGAPPYYLTSNATPYSTHHCGDG